MGDERVRVELVRTGGFAGVPVRVAVDTADVGPEEAGEVRRLVAGAALTDAQPAPAPPGRPDRFRYTLTVTVEGRTRQAAFGEDASPERRALVDHLLTIARSRQ